MLGRVALAFKLENPTSVQRLTSRPCRFIPSRHSLTCIRFLVASVKRAQNDPIPPAQSPQPVSVSRVIKACRLPPKETILQLFSKIPQNSSRVKQLEAIPKLREYFLDPNNALDLLYELASSKRPQNALLAINISRKMGREVGMTAYEVVVHRLGVLEDWPLVLRVIQSAWHNVHQSTPALLNWRARALLETQHYTALNSIFDLFKLNNFSPTRRTHHLVLSGYIRNHDLVGARECLRNMAAAGFPPDHSTHALIATLYQKIGPDEQVKEAGIQSLPHIHARAATRMMNSLMQLRLRIFDLDEVFHLLSAFDQRKVGPLALMLAASRTRHDESVQNPSVYRAYPTTVEPDAVTYAMFIDYFADLQELPNCLAILDHMLLAGIEPTMRTATSMIRAYFLGGQGGPAVRMITAMCDPETTSPAMFQNVPSPDGHALPFDVARLGPPTRAVFNYFLRGVLSTNGLPGAHTVIRLMRCNGVKPDSKTSEIITSHTHRVERAQPRVLMRMIRRHSPRFTLQEAHIVLASTVRYQKFLVDGVGWDVVAAKFSPTRTAGVKPYPEEAISTVQPHFDPLAGIQLPRRARHRGTFRAIEQSLVDRGIKSDRATIALRIRHDAVVRGDMNSATEVFQAMLARGLHPNQYHYSALMEGFVKAGDFESAVDVMKAASKARFEPDVLMFTILIVGYARRKDPEMALRIFRRMVSAGIQPDVPVIDAVASAFFFTGTYDMCHRVLTSLWQHITPLPPDIDKTSLKSAAVYFRSLHRGQQQGSKKTSNEFRKTLYRAIAGLLKDWRAFKRKESSRMHRASLEGNDV
ncbi:hypothetical protein MVEN_01531800 [Mycena venus]|uniref:PROP1-like PPR domain-containing protein n=1 Tax=Mycena venus TaxID=2733690 RepID=A0A8H6XVY9_9AGAR|nr:hypothetical protein MVEN_01531800 [Mycena venus]